MNFWKFKDQIDKIREVSILKTILINFYCLPFRQAIKFPILLSKYIKLKDLSGKIILNGDIRLGMVQIGLYGYHIFPKKCFGSFNNRGMICFNGNSIKIGRGCEILVSKNAKLIIGNEVRFNESCKIIVKNYVEIGDYTRVGWETQMMDSNFHFLVNKNTGEAKNILGKIIISNNNWFGNRCSVMKDTYTPQFSSFASNSLINRDYRGVDFSVYAGTPAKKIAENFYKASDKEEKQLKNKFNIIE